MLIRANELRCKNVINMRDGSCLGCPCDFDLDVPTARIVALIVFGRLRWFGLLGRGKDIIIPWQNIKVIGEDAILIDCPPFEERRRRRRR